MTENSADAVPDATPTVSQAVHLPDQQPVTPAPVTVAEKTSHTRTILEIVGGVVAVGLIFFSGAAGFVLGHVTANHDKRELGGNMMLRIERGQDWQRAPDLQGGPGLRPGGPGSQQGGPQQQGTVPSAPMG